MHKVATLYGRQYDFPARIGPPTKTYMIAAIPRTGSTFLSLALWRTGLLGAPLEYINYKNHTRIIEELGGGDLFEYWMRIKAVRTSPNGVFGLKAFLSNLSETAELEARILSDIEPQHVIYLTRRDRIAHVVSYALATQTNVWFSGVEPRKPARFNHRLISKMADLIQRQEEAWEKVFEIKSEKPIRLYYEDIIDDIEIAIKSICMIMNISPTSGSQINIPTIERQFNRTNVAWVDKVRGALKQATIDKD